MDAINEESRAVLASEDLGTVSSVTATGNIHYTSTAGNPTSLILDDDCTTTICAGTGDFPEFITYDRVFVPNYKITGEVTNVQIA